MPTDRHRRHEIAVAVVAYASTNPQARLPRNAARLLAAMFPTEDVYRRSLDDIATTGGFNRETLSATLKRLVEAGFLSRVSGSGSVPDTYRLHLSPVRQ
jgi:hypothetical protein